MVSLSLPLLLALVNSLAFCSINFVSPDDCCEGTSGLTFGTSIGLNSKVLPVVSCARKLIGVNASADSVSFLNPSYIEEPNKY